MMKVKKPEKRSNARTTPVMPEPVRILDDGPDRYQFVQWPDGLVGIVTTKTTDKKKYRKALQRAYKSAYAMETYSRESLAARFDGGYHVETPTEDEVLALSRIVKPDHSTPVTLRVMADTLALHILGSGYQPKDGKTYHLVHWPDSGLVAAVEGDPSDAASWREAVYGGYWTAIWLAIWPFGPLGTFQDE